MSFVRLCTRAELPSSGAMIERSVDGVALCVANEGGRYFAVGNTCPHRGAPLAEGSLEAGKVICPWHAWAFHLRTGKADHDPAEQVRVHALLFKEDEVQVEL